MTDTITTFALGGVLEDTNDPRILKALVLPYGEKGATSVGELTFEAGTVELPADPSTVRLKIQHDGEPSKNPIGSGVSFEETPQGIVGSFRIDEGFVGDRFLADHHKGNKKNISAEVGQLVIDGARAIKGTLTAAAAVVIGAFPSAAFFSLADPTESFRTEAESAARQQQHLFDLSTDSTALAAVQEVVDGKLSVDVETTPDEVIVHTLDADGTETNSTTFTPNQEQEPLVATATVPKTLVAAATTNPRPVDLGTMYAAIAAAKSHSQTEEQATMLAALSDIKISGSGALPAAGVLRENWVGPVWQGKTYERKYINLCKLGTDISAAGKKGFKITRGTSGTPKTILGGDWAGNKVEVPTGTAFTSTLGSTLDRFAFAADIAREFYDLPGGQEVVEAFIRLIVEDYAVWSDQKALALILATAGTAVAPKTYPTEYNGSIGMLLQGILAVNRAKDTPSYAIVNATAFEELLYTPKDKIPEFVSLQFSTELTGTADAGKITVVEAPDDAFTGLEDGEPAVTVGAKNAIEFDELGSTPIEIDALELAKGGIDKALHGYLQKFPVRPEAIVTIGTVETP